VVAGRTASKPKIEISTKRATVSSTTSASARAAARAKAARAALEERTARISGILGSIKQGVSSSTGIEVPGPGGEAYADYGQWVVEIYRNSWVPPNDLADDRATVTAEVVIRRSGTVESFKVIKRSGHAALDQSVEHLKRTVTFVAPFPDGATDPERKFIIDFNLRSKR
jgi:TonB family protein